MTLTDSAQSNYEPQDTPAATPDERISIWRLPKLVWAAGALFSMNLVIGVGMFGTSNIEADMYGDEVRAVSAAGLKPSPFTEVIDTTKRKVQVAAKLRPVVFEPAPIESQGVQVESASTLSLDIPRASRVAYELDIPVRTQNAVYEMPQATYQNADRPKKSSVTN